MPTARRGRGDQPAAQQQLADPVAGSHQIAAQILTRPDQIAQRFELERRDEHRPQHEARERRRSKTGRTPAHTG
jgi:hypothetical protein